MKSDANGVGSLALRWKTIRESFWTKVIYLFICIGTISGCAAAHSKNDCEDEAERKFPLAYGGLIGGNELSFEETGVRSMTEEEILSAATASTLVDLIICLDSATTDHAEPNVPLQPLWERLEFKL